jgi:hypothetical protein
MQQIEDAPTLAMTAGQTASAAAAAAAAGHSADGSMPMEPALDRATVEQQQAPGAAALAFQHQQQVAAGGLHPGQQQQQQQYGQRSRPQPPPPQPDQQQQDGRSPLAHPPPSPQQLQQQQVYIDAPSWLQHVNVSVAQLLGSIGLTQYVPLLEQQQVDMAALQLMEERHLRELGLPIGAVVKIRAALATHAASHASAK